MKGEGGIANWAPRPILHEQKWLEITCGRQTWILLIAICKQCGFFCILFFASLVLFQVVELTPFYLPCSDCAPFPSVILAWREIEAYTSFTASTRFVRAACRRCTGRSFVLFDYNYRWYTDTYWSWAVRSDWRLIFRSTLGPVYECRPSLNYDLNLHGAVLIVP